MAKLLSHYPLCPLIDSKSLLGIYEDQEKGSVIVTLGRNIAIKYKLSDQKQICSWRTKEKFSCPVVYDKNESKYVAAFNYSYIKLWTDEDESLDKLKKYKFKNEIYTIICCNNITFIIFKNGDIIPLNEALESRKSGQPQNIIDVNEEIVDLLHIASNERIYIALIAKSDEVYTLYWTEYKESRNKYFRVKMSRENFSLCGYILHKIGESIVLLTMWSDGKMFSCPLQQTDLEQSDPGELFAIIESLSTEQKVNMVRLDDDYICLFGADSNQEGALLIIYNTQFKVVQSKQPHKLFTDDARMWQIENNILLPVLQHLVVVPFCLETEQLAALVGSHKVTQIDADVMIVQEFEVADWKFSDKPKYKDFPETLKSKINDLLKQGLPESMLLEEILPEVLEKQSASLLKEILHYFTDIPERYLAQILKFLLACDKKRFPSTVQHSSELFPPLLQPLERVKLIELVMCKPFSDVLLLPHLKSLFDNDEVLSFLQYICFMLSEEGDCLPSMNALRTEEKLIYWGCVFIDANYQKLLFSKTDKSNEILTQFRDLIDKEIQAIEDIKQTIPSLLRCSKGTNYGVSSNVNLRYSIEQLSLY